MNTGFDQNAPYKKIEFRVEQPQQLQSVLTQVYPYLRVQNLHSAAASQATVHVTQLSKAEIIELKFSGKMLANTLNPAPYLSYIHILDGEAELQLNQGEKFQVTQNDVLVLEPGHELKGSISEHCHMVNLQIHKEDFDALMTRWFGSQHHTIQFANQPDLTKQQVKAGVNTIQSLLNYIDQFEVFLNAPLAMASLEEALYMTLLFSFQKKDVTLGNQIINTTPIEVVESYILNHLNESFSNRKLAELAECSVSQLIRDFKNKHGCTPLTFVHQKRLSHSRKLLIDHNIHYSVSHIASLCGFTHLGRFAQDYKKTFGETPSETIKYDKNLDNNMPKSG